jgi:site-specific DNA recombinase
VSYHGRLYPGAHEAIISQEIFDRAQVQLRAAKGRSKTLSPSYRLYLLKGLARCIYCGYPLWSQISVKGYGFYREPRRAREGYDYPAGGRAISCRLIDGQMDSIIKSLTLDPSWRQRIMEKLSKASEREGILKQRKQVEEKLRRLGRSYIDGVIDDGEYNVQRKLLQNTLDSLVVPGADAAVRAGEFLEGLGMVWGEATLEERHKLLASMLDAVYIDVEASRRIVGLQPKPPFYHLFDSLEHHPDSKVSVFREAKKETGPIQTTEPGTVMVETGES